MQYIKAKYLLLVVFFGLLSSPGLAQVNLKTGYNISLISLQDLEPVIENFNTLRGYTSGFPSLNWMHGFQAGMRYKANEHGIELYYQGAYQTLKAEGTNAGENFTDKFRFAVHAIGLGYQASSRVFGAGTNLQYQFYKSKFIPETGGSPFRDVQQMWAFKFYLMFMLQGNNSVDLSLQPFFILPLSSYDLDPLARFTGSDLSSNDDRWKRFGISLVFYNGAK